VHFTDYDIECIKNAKLIIDAHLEKHYRIEFLAAKVNIGTTKLKSGFHQYYGLGRKHCPIRTLIQLLRVIWKNGKVDFCLFTCRQISHQFLRQNFNSPAGILMPTKNNRHFSLPIPISNLNADIEVLLQLTGNIYLMLS
jgi:hypothetical protein